MMFEAPQPKGHGPARSVCGGTFRTQDAKHFDENVPDAKQNGTQCAVWFRNRAPMWPLAEPGPGHRF